MEKTILIECPNCGTSFYVKTSNGQQIVVICPICGENVRKSLK